jgi:multidrug efflux pump subunit AcrA (membrane-fusion protein)
VIKGNKTLVRSIVLAVAALIISIFVSQRLSAPKNIVGPKISFREAAVPVRPAVYEVHQASVTTSGRVKALNRFEIYAEVSGILRTDAFRVGASFKKGAVLVQVDDQEFAVQLKAQKSAFMGLMSQVLPDLAMDYKEQYKPWADFSAQIDVDKMLPELPNFKVPQLKSFLSPII